MTDAKLEIVTGQDPAKTTIRSTDHIGQITIHLTQDPAGQITRIDYSAEWIGKDGKPAKTPIIGDLTDRLDHDSLFNLGMEIAKIRDQLAREIPPF